MAVDATRGSNVLLQVFRTGQAVGQSLRHALAGTGVSADEWAVLSVVGLFGRRAFGDLWLTHLRGRLWRLRVG